MKIKLTRDDYEGQKKAFTQSSRMNKIEAEINEVVLEWLDKKLSKYPKEKKRP